MRRRTRGKLPVVLALAVAATLIVVPLTAGGQEDGRSSDAKPGPSLGEPSPEPQEASGDWDGDGPTPDHFIGVVGNNSIDGSLCVGFDCVAEEGFASDTIRLKENNLRIHFDDTSNTASFPDRDWRIRVNSSANGGPEYFLIQDVTAGLDVFRIDGDALNNALTIDAQGDIGVGLRPAALDLHIRRGDTPSIRLEQDGSSGFTPQTFDVASNEAGFFVRDATSGSTLPFRIRAGAPSSSIDIASDGEVGIGTSNPGASLHIDGDTASDELLITENTLPTVRLESTGNAPGLQAWETTITNNGALQWNLIGNAGTEFRVTEGGDVRIEGSLLAEGGDGSIDPGDTFPDYVFGSDYSLMTLSDLAAYIEANGHLPGVMSAADVSAAGAINMTLLQLQLLEKVEELTLYTIGQHTTIERQQSRIDGLQAENDSLRAQLADLAEAVAAFGD